MWRKSTLWALFLTYPRHSLKMTAFLYSALTWQLCHHRLPSHSHICSALENVTPASEANTGSTSSTQLLLPPHTPSAWEAAHVWQQQFYKPTSREVVGNLVSRHPHLHRLCDISGNYHLLFILVHGRRVMAGFGRISYRENRPYSWKWPLPLITGMLYGWK